MNTHIIPNPAPLVYNGVPIAMQDDTLSLTNMWIASGRVEAKRPANWARKEGADFIEHMRSVLNVPEGHIIKGTRGKNGETFAHWQIAMAYAKYLDHEFHAWCNTQVRAVMEGKASAGLSAETLDQIERCFGIMRMSIHKITGIEATVQTLAATVAAMAGLIQPPGDGIYVTGKTAGEIWQSHGFPSLKITCWFSNRLVKMGCQLEGGRRLPYGVSRAKLFDPDKADLWLRNGGKALVEQYVKEKQGQRKLRLVGGEGA